MRMVDGTLEKGDKIQLMSTNCTFEALKVGVFAPTMGDVRSYRPAKWAASSPASRTLPMPRSAIR